MREIQSCPAFLPQPTSTPSDWELVSDANDIATYVYNGALATYAHILEAQVVDGWDNGPIAYSVADFNAQAEAHEQHIISVLEQIWSPPVQISDQGGQSEMDDALAAQEAIRMTAFASTQATFENSDLLDFYSTLQAILVGTNGDPGFADALARVGQRIQTLQAGQ